MAGPWEKYGAQPDPALPPPRTVGGGQPWERYATPIETVDIPASTSPQAQSLPVGETWEFNADGTRKLIGQQSGDTLGGVVRGIAKPLDRAADYLAGAFGQDAPPAFQEMTAGLPTNGLGEFVGNTIPTFAIPGGAFVQGAAGGALLSDRHDIAGVATDMALGAAGSYVGDRLVRGISGAVSPRLSPQVQTLIDAGVPLTPGQIVGQGGIIGRSAKTLEDSFANVPVVGNAIRGARARANEGLNRAATNRALNPIGEELPAAVDVGHDAVAYAGDRLRAAYNDVLPRLSGTIDRGFSGRIQSIEQRATQGLPPEYQGRLDAINNELTQAFSQQGNQFSGRTLRDTSERLGDLAAGYRISDDPYLRRLGDVADQYRAQLHALARRENPAYATRLRDIDRGYASLVRIERAAAGTDEGIFTPGQYKTATRQSDRSVRKRQSARGQALDQDLSAAAVQVMPSTVGGGGSTAVNSLAFLGALGTGAVGGAPAALGTLGALGAGSLAYTPLSQRAIRWSMTGRQGPTANYLSDLLQLGAPIATASAPTTISNIRN